MRRKMKGAKASAKSATLIGKRSAGGPAAGTKASAKLIGDIMRI